MPTANVKSQVTVFEDPLTTPPSSNPLLRYVDWTRSQTGLKLGEILSKREVALAGVIKTLETAESGFPTIATFSSILPAPGKTTIYQFRTAGGELVASSTAVATIAQSYTFATVQDGTLTISSLSGSWSAFARGDTLYVSGSNYGDAGVASLENQGFWKVLSVVDTLITLERGDVTDPLGKSEIVVAAAVTNLQRTNDLTKFVFLRGAGAASVFTGVKKVVGVTQTWFAIAAEDQFYQQSAVALTNLSYKHYLSYVRVECDSPVEVGLGASPAGNPVVVQVTPPESSDPLVKPLGVFEALGFFPALTVTSYFYPSVTVSAIWARASE